MSKPVITHLILDTSCTSEAVSSEVDYCLIPLRPGYITDILKYMEITARMYKKDDTVYNLECWDATPAYFCFNDKMESLRDINGNLLCDVPGGEPILLTADPQFVETAFARVECQTIQITPIEVWWSGYPKHTNDRVETTHVSKKILLDILRRFKQPNNPA